MQERIHFGRKCEIRSSVLVVRCGSCGHVWGDQVYVDSSQNINFCIRQIRVALGDTSDGRIIETLPRQGYRFVAPLDAMLENIAEGAGQGARSGSLAKRWLIAGLAALVFLGVIVGLGDRVPGRNAVSRVTSISPITTYPGEEREPSLSPDGRQVAFSWGGEKGANRDIYVALVGEQHPFRLTSDPAEDAYPAWSPNGKQIAFVRRRIGTGADIMLIPALGGPEHKLYEIRLGAWITGRMLAWSPDGRWLCFTSEVGASGHHVLFLLGMDSGTVKRILPEEDNGVGDSSPAFSPDGKWLAFARFEHPYNSKLLLQRLSPALTPEGRPIMVKNAGLNPRAPVWMPDGKRILFLDNSRIMEAKMGEPARPVYVSDSAFTEITMAGASTRLVAGLKSRHGEIWNIILASKGMKAEGYPQPLVRSTAGESHPTFSPDGRRLAFASRRSGSVEVWLADTDGSNPRQLTRSAFYIAGYIHWSPDAQFLAFHGRLLKEPQLYIIGAGGGLVTQVTHGEPGFVGPSWSLDGQNLYADAFEGGTYRTYMVPVKGDAPQLLLEGSDAAEVPDRKLLIYDKQDQHGIYSRSLAGGVAHNPEQLLMPDYWARWGGFSPVANGIYYAGGDSHGTSRAFRFYSFDSGKSVDIAPSPTELG